MDRLLDVTLNALIGLMVLGFGAWAATRPSWAKKFPDRQRMPSFISIIGWVLLIVGALMTLLSIGIEASERTGPLIAGSCIFLGGFFFVMMRRNFYVQLEADRVRFRTVLGREKQIMYHDITTFVRYEQNGQPMMKVRAREGTKLDISTRIYRMDPMLAYLRTHPAPGIDHG